MSRTQGFVIHEVDCPVERWDQPATQQVRWRTLVSADRTPTDSLTVGVAEVEPGETKQFRPHRHAQPEVYYILAGCGVVIIAGLEYAVRPGSAVFIPGNTPHGACNTGTDLLRLLYVFAADSFDQIEYQFLEAEPQPASK